MAGEPRYTRSMAEQWMENMRTGRTILVENTTLVIDEHGAIDLSLPNRNNSESNANEGRLSTTTTYIYDVNKTSQRNQLEENKVHIEDSRSNTLSTYTQNHAGQSHLVQIETEGMRFIKTEPAEIPNMTREPEYPVISIPENQGRVPLVLDKTKAHSFDFPAIELNDLQDSRSSPILETIREETIMTDNDSQMNKSMLNIAISNHNYSKSPISMTGILPHDQDQGQYSKTCDTQVHINPEFCDKEINARHICTLNCLNIPNTRKVRYGVDYKMNKEIRCDSCDHMTKDDKEAEDHQRNCPAKMYIRCTICDYKTTRLTNMSTHMAYVHNTGAFICKLCGFKSDIRSDFLTHLDTQHEDNKMCQFCNYWAPTKDEYKEHFMIRHQTMYACEHCDYITSVMEFIRRHNRDAHENSLMSCMHCQYSTRNIYGIKRHIKAKHFNSRHVCKKCGYIAQDVITMRQHYKSAHKTGSFKCKECDFVANSKSYLNKHKQTIHQGLHLKCSQCNFITTTTTVLKTHFLHYHDKELKEKLGEMIFLK